MTTQLKKWTGLGLGAAILGSSLVGCSEAHHDDPSSHVVESTDSQNAKNHDTMAMGEMGEGGEAGESGETGHSMETLPREHRLAFMMGHVKTGLALYRAGEAEMAAPHLLHPVSETHASERAGLDALGFDGTLFEVVSKALEEGRPASEIEPQLVAAEKNLAMVAEKAGGDPSGIIRFLMDTVAEEYTIGITNGVVTDPGEYQDAYGFSIVAKETAVNLPEPQRSKVLAEIDELLTLWPAAPIPPASPTPVGRVLAQSSAVQLALPTQ